jgi:uncharacterized membrane protein YgcG
MKGNQVTKSWINTKAIFFVIFAFFFIFPALNWLGVYDSGNYAQPTNEYIIKSYNVDLQLGENNVLSVVEEINVVHNLPMHGIVRAIPTFQKISFLDSNQKEVNLNYQTKITDINANVTKEVSSESGFLFVRLGSAGQYVKGEKLYKISYNVNLGDDRVKDFDQFYYNFIGHDWDVRILNISLSLKLPKQIEAGKTLAIYPGRYGSANELKVTVEEDLQTFNFVYDGSLSAFEGITARIVLPEGYFNIAEKSNFVSYALLIAMLLIIVFAIIKIFKHKKEILTPVVMFTPPDNLPPSELGVILDGTVASRDISSLIVYWAQKGFISIVEENKKYTLVKQTEINENAPTYEKDIFNKIFETENEVKLNTLGGKIWVEVARAKLIIKNKHYTKNFNSKNNKLKDFLVFLSAIFITVVTVLGTIENVEPLNRIAVSITGLLGLGVMYLGIYKQSTHFKKSLDLNKNYLKLYIPILSVIWLGMIMLGLNNTVLGIVLSFTAMLASILTFVYAYKIDHRKPESYETLGELLGFKQFIALTEKDKIEMLAEKNPEIFFDVLPYAHVLGVSDVWMKKFEHIAIAQPSWLVTQSNFTVFDYIIMRSIFNSLFSSAAMQTSIASQLNATNTRGTKGGGFGGFGGGGGFSGGGFGGGGGRGW